MDHAFPEDELKPLSCQPLTRDRSNPAHIEVNDVLGNYSLTLIDSLSTLAILASSPQPLRNDRDPLKDFRNGITALVEQYGDGSEGERGQGKRSRGFDLDSKVQIFETVIRGVGGLLSAHLFATQELPIRQAPATVKKSALGALWRSSQKIAEKPSPTTFEYDGELLRLAVDLADRLLPAFYTDTGLPYPRVNLRHGVPFYLNSPLNVDSEYGVCQKQPSGAAEITETCSAGAGSLVLEFTTLSRLTGDPKYEKVAKQAFWAVWARRSDLDLLSSGVDAESGEWINSYAGVGGDKIVHYCYTDELQIGAGIDSFFEYALKSHILLSGTEGKTLTNNTNEFLSVWQVAHAGIKRHLYRGPAYQHPHYIQGDIYTGASKAFWIDSLSAYYPGLLTLGGELDEAIETHLLYTALWTRYAALPERWSTATGTIDAGLRWWGGRPEFIESTWYLYRATQDPYYLHVGEMALQDIQRRCWTECGWAGLEDVRTGELKDRMESFFLGETAKYLYLLFDTSHPLNKLDAPFVFTTEGHPLILPRSKRKSRKAIREIRIPVDTTDTIQTAMCPTPPAALPFSISAVTSRSDLFHAAGMARLHQIGQIENLKLTGNLMESSYNTDVYAEAVARSPNNFTFYPWTLPAEYIPAYGTSSRMQQRETFDLVFPNIPNTAPGTPFVTRVSEGVIINTVSGLKMGMTRERSVAEDLKMMDNFRIHSMGQLNLGRDEKVYLTVEIANGLNTVDPYFTRHRDLGLLDLVLDIPSSEELAQAEPTAVSVEDLQMELGNMTQQDASITAEPEGGLMSLLMQQLSQAFDTSAAGPIAAIIQSAQKQLKLVNSASQAEHPDAPSEQRTMIPASTSTGAGAGVIPDVPDAPFVRRIKAEPGTFWSRIYFGGTNCDDDESSEMPLPLSVVREHSVVVLKRGSCNFSEKLRNIAYFAPSATSLQLVIVVSYPGQSVDNHPEFAEHEAALDGLIRPFLEEEQVTSSGMKRHNPIPMVMIEGGETAMNTLRQARGIGIRRRYWYESQGTRIGNLVVL